MSTISPEVQLRRRWWQFRLRTLLIVVALLSAFFGLVVNPGLQQKRAIEDLRLKGATIVYAHKEHDTQNGPYVPTWWDRFRSWVGWDYFLRVEAVELKSFDAFRSRVDSTDSSPPIRLHPTWKDASKADTGVSLAPTVPTKNSGRSDPFGPPGLSEFLSGKPTRTPKFDADDAIRHLHQLRSLKRVEISGTAISDKALSQIANIRSIESLCLDDVSNAAGLHALKKLPRLKSIRLRIKNALENDLHHLDGLDQLEELDLSSYEATGNWMSHLPPLKSLRCLKFPTSPRSGQERPHDGLLTSLAKHSRLDTVDLGRLKLTTQSLRSLTNVPNLRTLALNGHQYEPGWLEILDDCPEIRELRIEYIGPENPSALSRLKKLESLTLSVYELPQAAEHLKDLPNLKVMRWHTWKHPLRPDQLARLNELMPNVRIEEEAKH